jgi:predicted AAA+ superfamily ATPase
LEKSAFSSVVVERIFPFYNPNDDSYRRDKAAGTFIEIYKKLQYLPSIANYKERVEMSYPFHPDFYTLIFDVYKLQTRTIHDTLIFCADYVSNLLISKDDHELIYPPSGMIH